MSTCCCLRAAGNGQTWVCLVQPLPCIPAPLPPSCHGRSAFAELSCTAAPVLPCLPVSAGSLGAPNRGWSTCASNRSAAPLPLAVAGISAAAGMLSTSPGGASASSGLAALGGWGSAASVEPSGAAALSGWGSAASVEHLRVLSDRATGSAEVPAAAGSASLSCSDSLAASEVSLLEDSLTTWVPIEQTLKEAVVARRGGKSCGSSATSSPTHASLDSASDSVDSPMGSPLDFERYGVVVKNGFLEEVSPRRRHSRCRSS